MSRVDQLFNSAVNLADLISQPTEEKTPGVADSAAPILNESDFLRRELPEPLEPAPEYDPEQEATNLVYMLKAGEGLLLPPIAVVTLKKKRGGKKAIDRMARAHAKQDKGSEELTDSEMKAAAAFEDYQRDFRKMMSLFAPDTPEAQKAMDLETKRLIEAAIPYCAATRFHVHAGFAFWTMYAGSLGGKIIQIIGA